jgi:hypothetical protein
MDDRVGVLDLPASAPVEVTGDAKACTLTAVVRGDKGRVARAELQLDSATGEVRGTLAIDERRETPIFGVRERDGKPAPAARARCPKPGIYDVVIDPNVEWESELAEEAGGFCLEGAQIDHALLRVGRLGETIIVDAVNASGDADPEPASDPAGSVENLKAAGECSVSFTFARPLLTFEAALVFAGSAAVGEERDAAYQMIEDSEDGDNLWLCKAPRAMLTGRWVRE